MADASERFLGAWRGKPEVQAAAATEVSRLGWLYVSRLTQDRRPHELLDLLARLGSKDLASLRAIHFLRSAPVLSLLAAGSDLLRRLPQSTRQARAVARQARGRIDWPATFKERIARGQDPSIFVIARSDRHTDLPENRALVHALRCIAEAASNLPKSHEAARLGLEAERLLSNAALASVRKQTVLPGSDRQALRLSRVREFREDVAAVVELHDALRSDDLDALRRLLGERVWLPPEADKLFELWVLFTTVSTLEETGGWTIRNLALIGVKQGFAPTFELEKEGKTLRLAYQTMPSSFVARSRYRELLDIYELSGAARRPDILVVAPRAGGALSFMIEAKLTEDRDYIVESAYKVLAYTMDFEASLKATPNPKAALVVWDGIGQTAIIPGEYPMVMLKATSVKDGALVPILQSLAEAATASSDPAR